ncbi:srg family chemoreceptor domain-containing protein [Ditylenchus destructor]|uniref:Serpentine receptor class gamma n=1 Tax=Ditylenchus destructor TaxID=166010 RepID=A0AAD4N097_9BILA|nr:srg family chemoreceptor domain-containing protein [Ditylenchus destructor]
MSSIAQYPYPPFIFSLIISVPTVIIYSIEIIILIKYRRGFNSPFFHLFIARFICNFLNYFGSFIFAKFGRVGAFLGFFESLHPQILAISFFFNFYSFHTDNLSTFFILLNRLTLLLFPNNQANIWKYFFPISILAIFLIPLPFTYPILGYNFYVRKQNDNWTFTLDYKKEEGKSYIPSPYFCAISAGTFSVVCGLLNILIIFLYHKSQKQFKMLPSAVTNRLKTENHKMESRLTIYAFVTFLGQLFLAIFNVSTRVI